MHGQFYFILKTDLKFTPLQGKRKVLIRQIRVQITTTSGHAAVFSEWQQSVSVQVTNY